MKVNHYEFYRKDWIENAESPVVYVIYAHQVDSFIDHSCMEPLTADESAQLPAAFAWTSKDDFLEQVLLTLRSDE
jgi:hypothetical protein